MEDCDRWRFVTSNTGFLEALGEKKTGQLVGASKVLLGSHGVTHRHAQSESSFERAHLHPHRRAHHYHHQVVGAKGQVSEGSTEPVSSRLRGSLLLPLQQRVSSYLGVTPCLVQRLSTLCLRETQRHQRLHLLLLLLSFGRGTRRVGLPVRPLTLCPGHFFTASPRGIPCS